MWAPRARLIHRISVLSSSSSSATWHGISEAFLCSSSSSSKAHCLLQQRCVVYNKITKNKLLLTKARDSSYENFMDDEKKMNILKRIIKLLLKQPGQKMLYRYMLRRGGYVGLVKPQKMGQILDKYSRIVRVYRNPNELDVWVTLAKPILELLEEEKMLKQQRAHLAAERLRKVLMMSATRRIRLDRINYLKEELGLPDNFKKTVVKANPQLFKLVITRVNLEKGVSPSVKLLEWDEKLAVPLIEAYRQDPATTSGLDEEGKKKKAYSFPINFPPNFKIKKGLRHKMRVWQELPYRSPYEDTSDLDLKSEEALKRAVAVIHEFLHITVEKRTRIDHLAHLREDYKLPQKLGVTVLQNPGIFYMSTKSNTQTIFLREGYKKGALLQKDLLVSIKEKFLALVRMGRKSVNKKQKQGLHTISDSDTSEEETECAEDMEIGGFEKLEGSERCLGEEEEEEGDNSSGNGHGVDDDEIGHESNFSDDGEDGSLSATHDEDTCGADDDVGQESNFSDNEDDGCLSVTHNEDTCGADDEVGQESDCSDDDDDSCVSATPNEDKEGPHHTNMVQSSSSEKDENEGILNGNGPEKDKNGMHFVEDEKGSMKDPFETEDDTEQNCPQVRRGYHEARHPSVQMK